MRVFICFVAIGTYVLRGRGSDRLGFSYLDIRLLRRRSHGYLAQVVKALLPGFGDFAKSWRIGRFLARCLRVVSSFALQRLLEGGDLLRVAREFVGFGDEEKRRGWSPMMSDWTKSGVACGQGKASEYEDC